jgi:primosomal protein N'
MNESDRLTSCHVAARHISARHISAHCGHVVTSHVTAGVGTVTGPMTAAMPNATTIAIAANKIFVFMAAASLRHMLFKNLL